VHPEVAGLYTGVAITNRGVMVLEYEKDGAFVRAMDEQGEREAPTALAGSLKQVPAIFERARWVDVWVGMNAVALPTIPSGRPVCLRPGCLTGPPLLRAVLSVQIVKEDLKRSGLYLHFHKYASGKTDEPLPSLPQQKGGEKMAGSSPMDVSEGKENQRGTHKVLQARSAIDDVGRRCIIE
jgi:hypothetical protein